MRHDLAFISNLLTHIKQKLGNKPDPPIVPHLIEREPEMFMSSVISLNLSTNLELYVTILQACQTEISLKQSSVQLITMNDKRTRKTEEERK